MGPSLKVLIDKSVSMQEFLTGCRRALAEILQAPPSTVVASAMRDGRYAEQIPKYVDNKYLFTLEIQDVEDAVCFVNLFEGVHCAPGELLANVEAGRPSDGPGLVLAAAAALALARLVGGQVDDDELEWTSIERAVPDVFVGNVRVESPGTEFGEQFAKFYSRLNHGVR
jgi:hypothetical protein